MYSKRRGGESAIPFDKLRTGAAKSQKLSPPFGRLPSAMLRAGRAGGMSTIAPQERRWKDHGEKLVLGFNHRDTENTEKTQCLSLRVTPVA